MHRRCNADTQAQAQARHKHEHRRSTAEALDRTFTKPML
jgi:hypothetical protein